jgi:multidrug efflux pump subunit AcrA (membrane-fusion protein)
VQAIPVTIGERYGNLVTILSGLKAGDQVITSGALNVHPGMSVAVEPSE